MPLFRTREKVEGMAIQATLHVDGTISNVSPVSIAAQEMKTRPKCPTCGGKTDYDKNGSLVCDDYGCSSRDNLDD